MMHYKLFLTHCHFRFQKFHDSLKKKNFFVKRFLLPLPFKNILSEFDINYSKWPLNCSKWTIKYKKLFLLKRMLNANEIAKPEKKVYSIRILERKCQKEKKNEEC